MSLQYYLPSPGFSPGQTFQLAGKIMKMNDLGAPPAPQNPQTMRQTNYHNPRDCHEKKFFFQKYENRFIFHIFRDPKIRIFMILEVFLTDYNRVSYSKWLVLLDFP